MYDEIMTPMQNVQPAAIEAATEVNGILVDIYDRLEADGYGSARGVMGSNSTYYSDTPTYKDEQLLVYGLTQQTFEESLHNQQFDAFMQEDIYIITHKTQLDLKQYQKVVLKYGGCTRTMEIFKTTVIDGIDGPIIKYAYLSPLT